MPNDRHPPIETIVRWTVASLSFTAVVVLFIMMDFGERGYHFDPARTYASNVTRGDNDGYDLSRLRVLTRCVGYIRSNYVDPSRADARAMVIAALKDVERRVPELMSDPVVEDGVTKAVVVRVGESEKRFDLAKVNDLYTMNWKLLDIFEYISPALSGSVQPKEVEYAAVNGLLRTLDPHSILLTPSVYREMKLGTTGKFGGLGIVIGAQDGRLVIQSVLDGTPAQRAGLKSADKIIQINNESTINMSLSEAVKRLRGPPGTPVDVWIMRKAFAEPRKFRIVRSNITLASVTGELLDGGIGYARIKNFQQTTGPDLRKAVERLAKEYKESDGADLRGFVLDLRDNPGGLLDQAIEVSDLFLSDGGIVTTVGGGNRVREEKVASPKRTWADLPLVVLVNAGSASASEIVAGALRNNDRAVIVGSTTFGKGSVQVIYDVDEAALKLTIAQYLTPGDESIQSVGITPHVTLVPVTLSEEKVNLNYDRAGGERNLKNHLDNSARTKRHDTDARVPYVADGAHPRTSDFATRLSTKMLLEAGRNTAKEMIARAGPIFALAKREQTAKMIEALGKLDIDWHEGANPKRPNLVATLTADRPGGRIAAGEKLTFELSVTNKGKTAVHRVRALTTSALDFFEGHDFLLGRIPAGETRRWKVQVDVPRSTYGRIVPVEAGIYLGSATTSARGVKPARLDVEIVGQARPRFATSVQVVDGADGVANPGENVTLRVSITNVGTGPALKTLAVLKNRGGDEVFITAGRAWLDGLAPGETHDVEFTVQVREGAPSNGPDLELRVRDTVLRQGIVHGLDMPYSSAVATQVEVKSGRWLLPTAGVTVFSGASATTGTIGVLAGGGAAYTDGRLGDWLRIPLLPARDGTDGTYGWISRKGLTVATTSVRVPQRAALVARPQLRQPDVELSGVVSLATDDPTIQLTGKALFPTLEDGEQPDVYIFRDNDKVYFRRAQTQGAADIPFEASVPLDKGMNKIAIYARAGRDLLYKHRVFVYRR